MRDRFSVARCCCVNFCENCCNGNAPTEWDAEVTLTDSACSTCDELVDGVYTLARLSNAICRWRFSQTAPSWSEECATGYSVYGDYVTSRILSLQILCTTETQYYILAELTLSRNYTTATEKIKNLDTGLDTIVASRAGYYYDYIRYDALVNFDEFICNEQVEYELDYQYSRFGRHFQFDWQPGLGFPFSLQAGWRSAPDLEHTGALPVGENYNTPNNLYWKPVCEFPATIKITAVP